MVVLVITPVVAYAGAQIGTNTTVISLTNPSAPGQAVDLEAVTVGYYPSGTVTFADETTVLCDAAPVSTFTSTGIAYCTASFAQGIHTITASYSGDSANAPSTGCIVQLIGADPIWVDGFECVRP
jgi:hypothetical protein